MQWLAAEQVDKPLLEPVKAQYTDAYTDHQASIDSFIPL